MDWYMEAKRREQERLDQASHDRLVEAVRAAHRPRRASIQSPFVIRLRGQLVMLGARLQTQQNRTP